MTSPTTNLIQRALVVTLLLVGAACSGDGDERRSPGPSTEAAEPADQIEPPGWEIVDQPTTEPPTFADEPAWGSDADGAMPFAETALFHDDVAIVVGGEEQATNRVDAVDLTTGRLLWTLEAPRSALPGGDGARLWIPSGQSMGIAVVDRAGESPDSWAVVVGYHRPGADRGTEYGAAALSGETGEVLWTTPIIPASEDAGLLQGFAGDGETVVVLSNVVDAETYDLTVLDPGDGSIRWEETGISRFAPPGSRATTAVVGGTVLANVAGGSAGDDDTAPPDQVADHTVVAWDAATGRRLWDLSERYPRSEVVLTAGDVVLVQVPAADTEDDEVPPGPTERIVVDARTGDELTSFGTHVNVCAGDQDDLVACSVIDLRARAAFRIATFRVEAREARVSEPVPDLARLMGVHGEHAYARDQSNTDLVMDRAGNVLGDAPGAFLAASDRYVMFADPDDDVGNWPYTILQVNV